MPRRSHYEDMIRNAMITLRESFRSECSFLTQKGTVGFVAVHFRKHDHPRVSWKREYLMEYSSDLDSDPMPQNMFPRTMDEESKGLALEVMEYTLRQYIHPNRKSVSGFIEFTFEDGLITNISALGSIDLEDCGKRNG